MSLLSDLIGLANDLTQQFGLQATNITYYAFDHVSGSGQKFYKPAVVRSAIYTRKQKEVRTVTGELSVSSAQVVFLDPTPVDVRDKIVLPDGTTQPIIALEGFVDASNGAVLTEISLG